MRKIQNKVIQMTAKPVVSFKSLCQYYCMCMCATIIKVNTQQDLSYFY